jgi:hypothetical protein
VPVEKYWEKKALLEDEDHEIGTSHGVRVIWALSKAFGWGSRGTGNSTE